MRSANRCAAWLAAALLAAAPAYADDKPLGVRLVDQMNALFGSHAGVRANHAKGAVFEGAFTPAPGAEALSAAAFLKGAPTPVVIRFSNSGGLPEAPDTHPSTGGIRGMAIKFRPAGGGEVDIVCISANGFPVSTGEDFLALLQAVGASKPDTPHPTPLEKFLGAHPAAVAFLTTKRPVPVSYATLPYFGNNAFKFTDAKGETKFGRYRIVPEAGEAFVGKEEADKRPPNALADDTRAAVEKGPVKFKLKVQVAAAGDPTNDATKVWPESRALVDLGEIAITKALDTRTVEKTLLFLPTNLMSGIDVGDDPIVATRTESYAESFGRRLR